MGDFGPPFKRDDMERYQQRVIEERDELALKIGKLDGFISSPKYHEIPGIEQNLLDEQAIAMEIYFDVLQRRINRF